MNLLVIEDDEVDRLAIRRYFAKAEMAVTIHEEVDALGGLRALIHGGFDGALMDFRLPNGDGLQVLRDARAQGCTTPVIMLTGQDDRQTAIDLLKAGAADYLGKNGLTAERLVTTVTNAVAAERARLRAQRAERVLTLLTEGTADRVGARFLTALCERVAEAFGARLVFISEAGTGTRGRVIARAPGGSSHSSAWLPLGSSLARQALSDGGAVEDTRSAAAQPVLEALGMTDVDGWLELQPLRDAGAGADRVVGLLGLVLSGGSDLAEHRAGMLRLFAARAAAELARLAAEQSLAVTLRHEHGLMACARALLLAREPMAFAAVEAALRPVLDAFTQQRLTLFLNDDANDGLFAAVARVERSLHASMPSARPSSALSYRAGLRRWRNDLENGAPISGEVRLLPADERPWLEAQGVTSVLAVALYRDGDWCGFLRLDDTVSLHRGWTRDDVRCLRAAADLIGAWLDRRPARGGSGPLQSTATTERSLV